MYLPAFQRVASSAVVKTVAALTVPGGATGVEIQADTKDVRYTMDNTTDPSDSSGMLFLITSEPKQFSIEDLRRIRFIQGSGGAGGLNFHFFGGRAI